MSSKTGRTVGKCKPLPFNVDPSGSSQDQTPHGNKENRADVAQLAEQLFRNQPVTFPSLHSPCVVGFRTGMGFLLSRAVISSLRHSRSPTDRVALPWTRSRHMPVTSRSRLRLPVVTTPVRMRHHLVTSFDRQRLVVYV